MKNILLFFLFLTYFNSYIDSQWFHTPTTLQDCNGLFFINEQTGFTTTGWTIKKTSNQGMEWLTVKTCYDYAGNLYFINQSTGFSAGYDLTMTVDGGNYWADRMPNAFLNDCYFLDANTGWFVGMNGKVLKTTNSGINFIPIFEAGENLWKVSFINQSTGIIIGNYRIMKTSNAGINWSIDTIGNKIYQAISKYNSSTVLIGGFKTSQEGFILKSTNWGQIWSEKPFPYKPLCLFMLDSFHTWIGCEGGYLYFSNNSLETWNLQTKLPYHVYSIFMINENLGFASSADGIWKTTNGGDPIGIKPISNKLPNNYTLNQNYPNPFNPSTAIEFDIPKRTNAKIIIYDAVGKEIMLLVNEELNAGRYRVNFDGSNLSSGMYFYRLVTDKYNETHKMVLIK